MTPMGRDVELYTILIMEKRKVEFEPEPSGIYSEHSRTAPLRKRREACYVLTPTAKLTLCDYKSETLNFCLKFEPQRNGNIRLEMKADLYLNTNVEG